MTNREWEAEYLVEKLAGRLDSNVQILPFENPSGLQQFHVKIIPETFEAYRARKSKGE